MWQNFTKKKVKLPKEKRKNSAINTHTGTTCIICTIRTFVKHCNKTVNHIHIESLLYIVTSLQLYKYLNTSG